jgi:hypothetical protein
LTLIRTYATLAVLAIVAFVAALTVGRAVSQPGSATETAPAGARTSFPGLEPAAAEPHLPGLTSLRPRPGEVVQATGPFDDRFVLRDLRLDAGTLDGTAQITSDVSHLLEFEAVAGFYDEQGRLLGTGRFVHHLEEGQGHVDHDATEAGHGGPPSELQEFSIPVPAGAQGRAVSAAVGVPVLVNE